MEMKERMWCVDVEGSGMSPPELVELALVELNGLHFTGRKECWRVRPARGVSPTAFRIHSIEEEDLTDAPRLHEIADNVRNLLRDWPVVGHNVRVDLSVLQRELVGWKPRSAFDTMFLARQLLPSQSQFGLSSLGATLGLDIVVANETGGSAHSALYDATLAGRLFVHLLKPLTEHDRKAVMLEADVLYDPQGSLF